MTLSYTPRVRDIAADKINKRISEEEQGLGNGSAEDWGDYRFRCGIIAGLEEAQHFLEEAYKIVTS
jgi:hypothetical protein